MTEQPERQPSRRRIAPILLSIATVIVTLDQATKNLAVAALTPGDTMPVIDGVLHWTLQRNPGAAFGILARYPGLFTVLAITVCAAILAWLPRVPDRMHGVALGFILGGAAGNLVDRLARDPAPFRGHVVDFIDLRVWPVFNVADMGVVCGAVLLVYASWRLDRATRADAEHP